MTSQSDQVRRNALISMAAVIGSRLFGLIREQIFAFLFGASSALDAYFVAFRIPNLLRDLFAEGALSQAFVTVFSQKKSDEEAFALANRVFSFLALVLGSIVVLGIVFSPTIVSFLASGFSGEKLLLTIKLNRVLFPFILFTSWAAVLMGMLNAKNRYFLPQSASTFFNITSIFSGLIFVHLCAPGYLGVIWAAIHNNGPTPTAAHTAQAILGMSIGTLLGGVVQWSVQLPALHKLGYRLQFTSQLKNPDLMRVLALTLPAVMGSAAVQVNVMTDTFFASHLSDGSVSYLTLAFRLMQFPLGLFGVAIATASAPTLSRLIAAGELDHFRTTLRSSLRMCAFLSLPSGAGLILLSDQIVGIIYRHGRFSQTDVHATALTLSAFSIGILGYSLIKIYQPAYLAFHDAKTPMRVAIFSMLLNVFFDWLFVGPLGLPCWGLALSTAIVATMNFVFLSILFRKLLPNVWDSVTRLALLKIFLATLVMAGVTYVAKSYFTWTDSLLLRFLSILICISSGSLSYFAATRMLKIDEMVTMIASVKKKLKRS